MSKGTTKIISIIKTGFEWLGVLKKITVVIFYMLIRTIKKIPQFVKKLPGYIAIAKKTAQKFFADDCIGFSAQLAFNLVLSLFPAILLMVTSLSFVQSKKAIRTVSEVVGEVLPEDIQKPISTAIDSAAKNTDSMKTKDTYALFISLLTSTVSASTSFLTIMKAMRHIYKIDDKVSFFSKYKTAFELVGIVGIAFFIILNILLASHKIETFLLSVTKWRGIAALFSTLKYPAAFLVIVITTTLVYKLSLRIGQRLEHVIPGAITVAVLWIPVSIWFEDFMRNQLYGNVYKTLAKLIAIPLWMYVNAVIFFIGAELNSILYKPAERRKKEKLAIRMKRFLQKMQTR